MRAKTILLNPQTCFILLLGAQQTTSFNVDHWYTASIGFATPGDYACGVIESRPEQVWLSLTSNSTSSGCYNLADVFADRIELGTALMAALPTDQREAATVYAQMVDPAMPPGRSTRGSATPDVEPGIAGRSTHPLGAAPGRD